MSDGNHNKKLISRREFLVGSGAVIAAVALTACSQNTVTTQQRLIQCQRQTPQPLHQASREVELLIWCN